MFSGQDFGAVADRIDWPTPVRANAGVDWDVCVRMGGSGAFKEKVR